jgi:spermidine synthase
MAGPLVVALGFAMTTDLNSLSQSAGTEVVAYREGAMASVAVVRTPDGHRSLRVNHRLQMGGTAAAVAERRQAHIPLLLHPDPKRALFLGSGTGITLGAAGAYPGLIADGVELLPEVKAMMRHFEPENGGPNLRVQAADARRFVRTSTNRYDVIVADLFHPAQDGAGFLYTREHFQTVRDRLKPGGLFCQWLPLHQLDEAVLRSIVRTFLETFSNTHAFLLHFNVDVPALALIGTLDPLRLPANWFEQRSQDNELRARLRDAGLDRPINLLGCHVAGPEELRRFAAEATMGTDDFPVVLFAAPRFSARRDTPSYELLLAFLAKCRAEPRQFVAGALGRDDKLSASLAAFVAARDVYLKGLVAEGNGDLSAAIEAYLEGARTSLFFTPAYARLVGIIQVLAETDRERARQLFQRLEEAQPAQSLGRKLLGPLFDK